MRVLQLGKFYPIRGGVEKVMYDLMKGLSEAEVQCDMLCASDNLKIQAIRLNENATLYAVSSITKVYGTMISPQLITELKRIASQYDIIHIHHPDPMAALALWMSDYQGKVVLHWHSDILKQKLLLKLIMPLQKWLLRRSDLIIGTTPVYVKESPHLKDVQEKVTFLPIGIEPLECCPRKVQEIRNTYPGKKIIFSLGRLVEYKGFEYLVKAATKLPDNYIIIIGGIGPLMRKLSNIISIEHLQDKVKLLGKISDADLPSYYGACDLFCLSSVMKTEAFAIVQIEAMSLGKPIVATWIPQSGVPWVNADGFSGINVEVRNSDALAKAICSVLETPKLYKQFSDGAINRYKNLFTKSRMIDNCIKLYMSILCNQ